jgi:hypothetical protein
LEIKEGLKKDPSQNIQEEWENIKRVIKGAENEILGMKERKVREEWFDEKCKQITKERNRIRQKMMVRCTRSIAEEYKEIRKTAKKICRKKKRI